MNTTMKLKTLTAILALTASAAFAQSQKVKGVNTIARAGSTMTLETADAPKLVVLLTDSTDVPQVEGALKARNKEMSMAP